MTSFAKSTDRIGTTDRGSVPLRGHAEDSHKFVESGQDGIDRVGRRHADTLAKSPLAEVEGEIRRDEVPPERDVPQTASLVPWPSTPS